MPREITLASYGDIPESFSLSLLLDAAATPRLAHLALSAYFEALPRFLQLLAAERGLLERIDNVSLHPSDFSGEHTQLLRPATLPASIRRIADALDYVQRRGYPYRNMSNPPGWL